MYFVRYTTYLSSKISRRRILYTNPYGCYPLFLLPRFFLDDMSTDPELRDSRGDTPLNTAAYNGQYAAAEELLKRGANVNSKNNKVGESETDIRSSVWFGLHMSFNTMTQKGEGEIETNAEIEYQFDLVNVAAR